MTETAPTKTAPAASPTRDTGAQIVHGVLASVSIVSLVVAGWRGVLVMDGAVLTDLVARHAPAVIGLPFAAAISTCVICGLRAIDGRLRLKLLGLETEGAGAALLGWIAIFSAVTLAVRALW